mgnify:CR=1 FL=1
MALQLMNSPSPDEWDARAFGWCLIDLIKRDAKAEKTENLKYPFLDSTLGVFPFGYTEFPI